MADISIQFHATLDEIVPLLRSFVDETDVSLCAIKYSPFQAIPMEKPDLEAILQRSDVPQVAFTLARPFLPANGMMHFLDQNPAALLLDVGRKVEAGLQESCLSARTSDKTTLAVWRRLSRRVIAATRTGVIAVNPKTGETAPLRSHRFSNGAKALERAGVPILPVAGTARLRFGD
jgi:hypothetical protein